MNLDKYLQELRGLDINNVGGWPRWAQIGATLLLCFLLFFLGFRFLIQPKQAELEQAKQEEQQLRSEFETKQKKVANLDAYKRQLDEMQHSFGAMLKQLPSKSEVANLLNDISQTRVASGLEENLFEPQAEQPKEFYAELPINLQVVGTYQQMGTFVSNIAALPRIVTIGEVNIKPVGALPNNATLPPNAQLQPSKLGISMVARTYRYLDSEEQAAANKPTAPK